MSGVILYILLVLLAVVVLAALAFIGLYFKVKFLFV